MASTDESSVDASPSVLAMVAAAKHGEARSSSNALCLPDCVATTFRAVAPVPAICRCDAIAHFACDWPDVVGSDGLFCGCAAVPGVSFGGSLQIIQEHVQTLLADTIRRSMVAKAGNASGMLRPPGHRWVAAFSIILIMAGREAGSLNHGAASSRASDCATISEMPVPFFDPLHFDFAEQGLQCRSLVARSTPISSAGNAGCPRSTRGLMHPQMVAGGLRFAIFARLSNSWMNSFAFSWGSNCGVSR